MRNIEDYQREYSADYGFEAYMVQYRQRLVLSFLQEYAPRSIVEIGCGEDLLAAHYQAMGATWERWTIVEPALKFADIARAANLPAMEVVEGFFEEVMGDIAHQPDVIICSGLLHEVPDAKRLCDAIAQVMGPQTILHANVPNANSLHRVLAQAMGLLDDLKERSVRNKTLNQPRVFDAASLRALIESCGMEIRKTGGHLVKPFTHAQMEKIVPIIGQDVLDGLYHLGQTHPDMASEIFIEAALT